MFNSTKITLTYCFLLITSFFYSQNLVPNPSFETYTMCPNSTSQLSYTGNWFISAGTTDYYNSCSIPGSMSVPSNIYGYQNAYSGNGYVGLNFFSLHSNYREPLSTKLSQTLVTSQKYYVSFKVALTINNFESCCATNKLGALFSVNPFSSSFPPPIKNFAHIFSNTIITDSLYWTSIYGSFTSDSSYRYITIGNFFDSLNTGIVDYNNNYPLTLGSYYFVDEVRVSTDSNFVLASVKESEKLTNDLIVFPNPASDKIFIKGMQNYEIELYDVFGQKILQIDYNVGEGINISTFNSGIYILNIKTKNDQHYKPIKIQKL